MITIREMKQKTGITVRTLRYYDQIGLLQPSGKTEGGHRLYESKDLQRLQYIQFLKSIGFRLQEIKEILSDASWNWSASLHNQLVFVMKEQSKLKQTELTLRGLLHTIAVEGEINLTMIHKLIQLMGNDQASKEAYRLEMFDEHEVQLFDKLPNINRDDPDSLEWIALIGQLKRYMKDGPESSQVQRIVARMNEKQLETFEGDEQFIEKFWEIRKSPEQSEQIGLYPVDQELLDFLEEAFEIYFRRNQENNDFLVQEVRR